jgi:hypothetical protein
MLVNLDEILNDFDAWDDCDVYFLYVTAVPISVV